MDFSTLTPTPAPRAVPSTAVVVGENLPADADTMYDAFTRAFAADTLDEPALVVTTSGSTGKPKQTVLTAGALQASAQATADTTSSQGAQWMLALPLHYVAGAQVVARSAFAGVRPVITRSITRHTPFTPEDFLATAQRMHPGARMLSLVPAQLHTLLDSHNEQVLSELQSFTALLLGGAPASARLLKQCKDLNVNVVTTYGSAETAGGCVYNSRPLTGVRIEIQEPDEQGVGRVWLGGDTLASGYLNDAEKTSASFFQDTHGNRWYRTDDRGSLTNSVLTIEGRADDVLITGGIKVSARKITERLEEHAAIREAIVTGIPHPKWGQMVAAMVTLTPGASAPQSQEFTDFVASALGKPAAPKVIEVCERFPVASTGKPDRRAIHQMLAQAAAAKDQL
ncbi:AMP-binding protein [Rothia terrae]|uniref:AMP-binding protein n=1 Tax=Rothia terrae TaxID=396015 RepID=UPI001445423C|nr:AMP-binding protein [Rothia terrae]NKZ34343.1 AMP-binding protein [Rothia terrae]